jgi:HK97 family phage major capsid protein
MDPVSKFSLAVGEAGQHRAAAELLIAEAAKELQEAERKSVQAQRSGRRMARAFEASGSLDWNEARDVREESTRLSLEWGGIQPRATNGFFINAPLTRTLTVATASAGGYVVGNAEPQAITAAHAANSFLDLCSVVTAQMGSGKQLIAKFSTLPAASILATESTQATSVGALAAQAIIGPSSVVAYEEASRQWALSAPGGADTLATLLLNSVHTKIGQQIIEGSGSNAEFTGLVNDASVANAAGTTLAMSHVAAALESVEKQAGGGALAWIVTAPAATIMRQRGVVATGSPAILSDLRIGGYPAFVVGGTTNAHAVFGRWADLLVYQWAPIEVAVNPFANFQAGIIGVRAWASVNAAPLVSGSFYVIKSIT